MKNIFNLNKPTSTPANKRTKFTVILKSAVVTSILKNLSIKKVKKSSTDVLHSSSLRAKRGNLYASVHSLHLAQGSRRKAHGVFFPQLSTINHKLLTLSLAHGTKRTAQGVLLFSLLFGFVMLNAQMVGELGRWEYGPTEAIAVKGNTAYISSGSYLWVMDISNILSPLNKS